MSAGPSLASRVRRVGLRVFARLPGRARSRLVRWGAPSFQVGAMCYIERADGAVLLVRDRYRAGWGLPGGLVKRGEHPIEAARREAREEVGLDLAVAVHAVVVVEPRVRRVDVVYRASVQDPEAEPRPTSDEIVEVGWFPAEALPELQKEAATAIVELGRDAVPPAPPEGGRQRER